MKPTLVRAPAALALAATSAALLAACGSQTKTVTATNAPPAAQAATSTQTQTQQTAPPSTTQTPTTSNSGGTPAEGAHTAPEPAFTEHESHGEGANAAAAVVHAHGYTPTDPSQYHSNQTLRVLVGERAGSGQQAFFFVGNRYIGTDTMQPSASVKVSSQGDTEVTLVYPLYRSGDPLCCPGGGQATVHFQLNNGRLVPLDPIPPASSKTELSRN
jgi:hypothetical protein